MPDVESLRRQQRDHWGVAPDYHPYLVVGDLNSDAEADLAVVVVDPLGEWMFLIFNGPLEVGATPSFVDTGLDFERKGLFYGPPRPEPYRLVVGPFESHGALVLPKGTTYEIKWAEY